MGQQTRSLVLGRVLSRHIEILLTLSGSKRRSFPPRGYDFSRYSVCTRLVLGMFLEEAILPNKSI